VWLIQKPGHTPGAPSAGTEAPVSLTLGVSARRDRPTVRCSAPVSVPPCWATSRTLRRRGGGVKLAGRDGRHRPRFAR